MNTSASGAEDGDALREARAYNRSIYFMLPVPYLLLGTIGFMIFRSYKSAEKRARSSLEPRLNADRRPGPELPHESG